MARLIASSLSVVLLLAACSRSGSESPSPGGADAPDAPAASPPASQGAQERAAASATPAGVVPGAGALETFTPWRKPRDPAAVPGMVRTPSGLEYAILKEGQGEPPPLGATVKVHNTGWERIDDKVGGQFWSSRDDGVPHTYRLKQGELIPAWIEALQTMKRGERRWLLVPSALGYDRQGYFGYVRPNADLIFDLELVDYTLDVARGQAR
jgi:FKBP-type peptidyl-prolyl cis-trans isomerase FkpA